MGKDELNEDHSENDNKLQACGWCQKVRLIQTQYGNLICPTCYQILMDAGISEEEIFEKT